MTAAFFFGVAPTTNARSLPPAPAARDVVFAHMKLTIIGKTSGVPIYRFTECRHYAKDHMKIAQVGVTADGLPILRFVPGDYCDRPPVRQEPSPKAVVQPNNSMAGVASWYGGEFNGRIAASGEAFDMEQLTAAHRTLPFGTRVLVHRTDNGKSVEVRINDRGPYVAQRVIDLSKAAARRLDMTTPGIAPVSLAVVSAGSGNVLDKFAVQVAAFKIPENARHYRDLMERAYGSARIIVRHREIDLWAVLVGEVASESEAEVLAARVRVDYSEVQSAFVVRLDELPLASD